MDKIRFKERFRELYNISGCPSVTQFAKQLDLNRQSVDRYYNGERCPDASALVQICDKMNISADWLLGLSDVREPSADLCAVCEYTGLSEEAVNRITSNNDEWPMAVDALSQLIVSPGFNEVVDSYSAFLSLLEKLEYKPAIENLISYQQRADGTIEMSAYEAIHYFMNKATMAFNSICKSEFDNKMAIIHTRDYDTPEDSAGLGDADKETSDTE